jgi:hypothetical protein
MAAKGKRSGELHGARWVLFRQFTQPTHGGLQSVVAQAPELFCSDESHRRILVVEGLAKRLAGSLPKRTKRSGSTQAIDSILRLQFLGVLCERSAGHRCAFFSLGRNGDQGKHGERQPGTMREPS